MSYKPTGKPTGRPPMYSNRLAVAFCARVAEGNMVADVTTEEGMPSQTTVIRWLQSKADFRMLYARAKEMQCERLFARGLRVASTPLEVKRTKRYKKLLPLKPGEQVQREEVLIEETVIDNVERSRLEVDYIKFALAKLMPHKYGPKVEIDLPPVNDSREALRRRAMEFFDEEQKRIGDGDGETGSIQ